MALPKGVYRKRRQTSLSGIPKNILEYFQGKRKFTFYIYTFPYRAHLNEYWAAFLAENPGATMPEGLETLLKTAAYPSWYKKGVDNE